MLTLGAGSSCDICFEKFGQDLKAPCSITCGHVFCAGCINNITRLCPLCRTPFEKHFCIKLHLDVDGIPPERLGTVNADTQEAQRLQQAIASVADEGTTEPRLRQLIQECKTFLHGQPRSQYKELRVAHRMIAYLCDCRTSLRSNNQLLDAQKEEVIQLTTEKKQLTTEKEELQKQIMKVMETQKYDIEMALAVEASLRDHYTRMVE
ncbi:hypothetical protein B0H34DRAFT_660395 [Crassisporium funariophilum]|nr:hypothetical protein B0H34DRAFT_660395 [Crassisporium funariophilum]